MAGRQFRIFLISLLAGTALAGPALADPAGLKDGPYGEARLEPGLYPAAPVPDAFRVPAEAGHSPFDIDWSVGLKGTYSHTNAGNSFVKTLTPQFTATHDGPRLDVTVKGGADLAHAQETLDLTGLRLGIDGTMALDSVTRLTGNASLDLSGQLPNQPGLPSAVTHPPDVITGSLGLGAERQFGRFNVGVTGTANRVVTGPSQRSDTGLTDNSDQNYWALDSGLRVGYRVTPIFEVFGQGNIGRDIFDRPSTSLMVRQDGTQRTLRAGIAGKWGSVLSASASMGVGEYVFDAPGLAPVATRLYDASVTFSPDPTLNMTAALSTTISPPGAGSNATAKVDHAALANVDYTVNSWLRLRASADWGLSLLEGNGETERRQGLGLGADYLVNDHATISADYGYAQRENSNTGKLDAHTVSLGVTVKR